MFIADHCPSLQQEALKMALAHVHTTYNTQMYQTIHKKLVDSITRYMYILSPKSTLSNQNESFVTGYVNSCDVVLTCMGSGIIGYSCYALRCFCQPTTSSVGTRSINLVL